MYGVGGRPLIANVRRQRKFRILRLSERFPIPQSTIWSAKYRDRDMSNQLIIPMAVHVALAAMLYALLTIVRAPTVWGLGRKADGSNPWAGIEKRVSANLSNQFEWPLFFYAVCLLLMQKHEIDQAQISLAWLFICGRFAHSSVQILTTNVRLRGTVFTVNFVAVLGMWIGLVFAQLSSGH